MRTSSRHFGLPLALLSAASLVLGLLSPVTAPALAGGQSDPSAQRESRELQRASRLEDRATRARERLAAREQARSAREQERAARRATRAQERAARHRERGGPAGEQPAGSPGDPETGTGPATGEPAKPASSEAGERCRATIESSASRITAGETVTIFGKLTCPSPISAAARRVTVFQGQRGSAPASFAALGIATTEPDGSYKLTPLAFETNTVFRVRVGNHGARAVVKVAPVVTVSGPSPTATLSTESHRAPGRPGKVTFSGTVTPHDGASRVALQVAYAAAGEQWRTVAYGNVGADGTYLVGHGFRTAGQASIRVVARMRGQNVAAASEPLSYEVLQAQNPSLTIQASTGSAAFGESITISGVAAGSGHQTVTLLAHTYGGAVSKLATATTDEAGNYSFTHAPSQSTAYAVTDGANRSTVLYEGVRRSLSLVPVATTAVAGQQIVFTGTLSPAADGQLVYAQRENPSGIGFHTVATATVTSAGYAIAHVFSNPGSYVMRIKVPGDPAFQATTSQPFNLVVTGAPASALVPEAPAGGHVGES